MRFRISDFGFRIFATIAIATLLPHASFGAEKKDRSAHSGPSFAATVNGHAISIEFNFGKFDPKKRVVTKRKAKTDAGEPYEQILLNGKPILGTDNADPRQVWRDKAAEVIEQIRITWDGVPVKVPSTLFDHVVAPHKDTSFANGQKPHVFFLADPSGEALIVEMMVGDGGGLDMIHWLFRRDGNHKILDRMFFSLDP